MANKILASIGIILTIVFGLLPFYTETIPSWAETVGILAGVFLLGIALGMYLSRRKVANSANIQLHSFGDHRTAEIIKQSNVFRWFTLKTIINKASADGTSKREILQEVLIVCFENNTTAGTLKVRSPDMQLPLHEVKDFCPRYAIIGFDGAIPAGTLEITAE